MANECPSWHAQNGITYILLWLISVMDGLNSHRIYRKLEVLEHLSSCTLEVHWHSGTVREVIDNQVDALL